MSNALVDILSIFFGPGDPDYYGKTFNTQLPPDVLDDYNAWIESESSRQGRDLRRDVGDYDVAGYWLAGERPDERGHGTDMYKKPNHPTFSNESIYNDDQRVGGYWGDGKFFVGPENLKHYSREDLMRYFNLYEPDVTPIFPGAE